MSERLERELGQVIREYFQTKDATGKLTNSFRSKLVPANPPVFAMRARSSGSVIASNPPQVTVNETAGRHKFIWDTSQSTDAEINEDYDFVCTDGEVSSDGGSTWVDVTNQIIFSLSLQNATAGFVLQRALKMAAFTIESVTSASVFEVSGAQLIQTAGYYNQMGVVFDPGSTNFGRGGIVRRSQAGTGNRVRIELVQALVATPQPGDSGAFIPEENPEETYWANITAEFGPLDTYSAEWFHGSHPKNVDTGYSTFITITRVSNATVVANLQPMTKQTHSAGEVWKYQTTYANSIAANDKAHISVFAYIDGETRVFNRTLANAT